MWYGEATCHAVDYVASHDFFLQPGVLRVGFILCMASVGSMWVSPAFGEDPLLCAAMRGVASRATLDPWGYFYGLPLILLFLMDAVYSKMAAKLCS